MTMTPWRIRSHRVSDRLRPGEFLATVTEEGSMCEALDSEWRDLSILTPASAPRVTSRSAQLQVSATQLQLQLHSSSSRHCAPPTPLPLQRNPSPGPRQLNSTPRPTQLNSKRERS